MPSIDRKTSSQLLRLARAGDEALLRMRLDVERGAVAEPRDDAGRRVGRCRRQIAEARPRLAGELRHVADERLVEAAAGDQDLARRRPCAVCAARRRTRSAFSAIWPVVAGSRPRQPIPSRRTPGNSRLFIACSRRERRGRWDGKGTNRRRADSKVPKVYCGDGALAPSPRRILARRQPDVGPRPCRRTPRSRRPQSRRTGRAFADRTAPASRPRPTSRPSSDRRRSCCWRLPLPPGHSSPILLDDRDLPDGVPRRRAGDDRGRSDEGPDSLGAAGAAGEDEGRRQAQQPGVAESGGRSQRRLRVLPRLRPDCLRRGGPRAVEDAARAVQQHLRDGRIAGDRR